MILNGPVNGAALNRLPVDGETLPAIIVINVPTSISATPCRRMRLFGENSLRSSKLFSASRPAWLAKVTTCQLVLEGRIYPPESAWVTY